MARVCHSLSVLTPVRVQICGNTCTLHEMAYVYIISFNIHNNPIILKIVKPETLKG